MERAAQREGCVAGRETQKHAGLHGSDRASGEGSEWGAQAKGEPRGHPGRRGCNNAPPPKSKTKRLGREKARRTAGALLQPRLAAPAVGTSPGPGTPGLRAGPSRACPLAAPALLWGAPPGGRDLEARDMERELCWRTRGATALPRAGSNAAPPPESEEGVPV